MEGPSYDPPLPKWADPLHRLSTTGCSDWLLPTPCHRQQRRADIPPRLREGKSLPTTTNRKKLNYASGEESKDDALRPLQARSELAHGACSILICLCSVGRGQLWYTVSSRAQESGFVIVSDECQLCCNSPRRTERQTCCVQRVKSSIIFPSPLLCAPSSPLAAKEKSPSEVTLRLSWTHMTLPLRILHPLCLTEVMKIKLLALCLFSVISSVCCQRPEPRPFPIQGITVSSECTQGWERCASQWPSWACVKRLRLRPCQDLQCLHSRYWWLT